MNKNIEIRRIISNVCENIERNDDIKEKTKLGNLVSNYIYTTYNFLKVDFKNYSNGNKDTVWKVTDRNYSLGTIGYIKTKWFKHENDWAIDIYEVKPIKSECIVYQKSI